MFKHSTRVPRLYKISAKIAKDVKEGIDSIKNLVYENKNKHPNIKAVYALVTTLFQKYNEIESLLKKSQFLTNEPRADPWLTKILIVELLWGKKRLPGDSIPEKTIQAYEQIFKAHITNTSTITVENDTQGDTKPRYVRINTLFINLDEAVEGFRSEGWKLCKFFDKTDYKGFLHKITSLSEDEFMIDIHVPNLLIFPPKTQFYNHPAYKDGSIVLQDKASCLPVHILNPPPGSVVLDMCAAPGMKTTQLAAVMNNEGIIYAVERNPKRFETLNKIVDSSKAACIKTQNKDVLTCFADDFQGVQYILVDPSCSGSGMTDRLEGEQEVNKERIAKLAGFQIKILRSALTRYPDVKRVVYSTCSVYPEENEDVVRQVMETNTKFRLVPAKQFVNDTWENVGSSDYGEIGKYCLYAKPNEDFTNGFFVAVFERLKNDEVNQFFNTKVYNYKKHLQSQQNRKRQGVHEENISHTNYRAIDLYKSNVHNKIENEKGNYAVGGVTVKARKGEFKEDLVENITNDRGDYIKKQKSEDDYLKENVETVDGRIEARTNKKKKKKMDISEGMSEELENVVEEEHENKQRKYLEHESVEEHTDVEVVKRKKKNKKKDRKLTDNCEVTVSEEPENAVEEENENKKPKYLEHESAEEHTDVEVVKRKKKKNKKDRELSDNSKVTVPKKANLKHPPVAISVTEITNDVINNSSKEEYFANLSVENHEQSYMKLKKIKKKKKDKEVSNELLVIEPKKKKKKKSISINEIINVDNDIDENSEKVKPKKSANEVDNDAETSTTSVKHKKNKKDKDSLNEHLAINGKKKKAIESENGSDQKSEMKKSKHSGDVLAEYDLQIEPLKCKKKKKKGLPIEHETIAIENDNEVFEKKNNNEMQESFKCSSKKWKDLSTESVEAVNESDIEVTVKNKKRKYRELYN